MSTLGKEKRMTRTQKFNTGSLVFLLFVVCTLVMTFLTTPSVTGTAHAAGRHHDKTSCDSKVFKRYVGLGGSLVMARIDVKMHYCWRHVHLKHRAGYITKASVSTRIYNTGWGEFHGANWSIMEQYAPYARGTLVVAKQRHIAMRQCFTILGQHRCGPAADFSVGGQFTSPLLADKGPVCPGPCGPRYEFSWYKGEPHQQPGSYDSKIWICDYMCE